MDNIKRLPLSQKLILLGNCLITAGSMITSVGSLVASASTGSLPTESIVPFQSASKGSASIQNPAKSYFQD